MKTNKLETLRKYIVLLVKISCPNKENTLYIIIIIKFVHHMLLK